MNILFYLHINILFNSVRKLTKTFKILFTLREKRIWKIICINAKKGTHVAVTLVIWEIAEENCVTDIILFVKNSSHVDKSLFRSMNQNGAFSKPSAWGRLNNTKMVSRVLLNWRIKIIQRELIREKKTLYVCFSTLIKLIGRCFTRKCTSDK